MKLLQHFLKTRNSLFLDVIEIEPAVQPIFTYVVEFSPYHGLLKLPTQLRREYNIDQMLYRVRILELPNIRPFFRSMARMIRALAAGKAVSLSNT